MCIFYEIAYSKSYLRYDERLWKLETYQLENTLTLCDSYITFFLNIDIYFI